MRARSYGTLGLSSNDVQLNENELVRICRFPPSVRCMQMCELEMVSQALDQTLIETSETVQSMLCDVIAFSRSC